jgi:hypothetical protein
MSKEILAVGVKGKEGKGRRFFLVTKIGTKSGLKLWE